MKPSSRTDFLDFFKNPTRARLRRIRQSLVDGAPLDPSDAAYLIDALGEIERLWPATPKRPDDLGRIFTRAFGAVQSPGRRKPSTRAEVLPRVAVARTMLEAMARGDGYDAARALTAERHRVSESTVDRFYREHRGDAEAEQQTHRAIRALLERHAEK